VLDETVAATPKHLRYLKGVGKLMELLDVDKGITGEGLTNI